MRSLKTIINSLHDTNFLTTRCILNNNSQISFEPLLLKNGQSVKQNLLNLWHDTKTNWVRKCVNIKEKEFTRFENESRLSFLENIEFQKNYEKFYKPNLMKLDSIEFKTVTDCAVDNYGYNGGLFNYISDGLEKFHNIQRERKIWWMRYSANPSRFLVESFDLSKDITNEKLCEKCKSVTIKAQFPFGFTDIESITFVPLNELGFSLIRSVINLELTTSALILDGKEHNRGTALMLNRKLAPFQILLLNANEKDKITDELKLHLEYVIRKSGLRLYNESVLRKCNSKFDGDVIYFDSLGIPYILVIDKDSIKTGLMKLRSRDTTLYETIHISDIPNYLLFLSNK